MDPIVTVAVLALVVCAVIFIRQVLASRCPHCGKWIRVAQRYCPRCGAELG
ncbi:MAG: zinc ribbon domain-containing protein [Candidatus Limnocylindria bacterium]